MVSTPGSVLGSIGVEGWLPRLAQYERQRASAFRRESARASYVAGHVLIRMVAARWMGAEMDRMVLSQHCRDCGGSHGQPRIESCPGLCLSMSHCDEAIAAVASDLPVGIDVEASCNSAGLVSNGIPAFSARELQLLHGLSPVERDALALTIWVRKESLVKLGRLTLDTLEACDLVDAAPEDLMFVDFGHVASRCVGSVASSRPIDVEFLD